jgi:PASTA domain
MLVNARLAARAGGVLLPLLASGWIAGCGDETDPRPVRLDVSAPADATVVHEGRVEVRGVVRPAGARVLVLGRPANVSGREFRALVPLHPGSNVIDLAGSAPGARSSWATVRVAREVLVTVPDVTGMGRENAVNELEAVALRPQVQEANGLLDELFGGDWVVCAQRPDAGTEVRRGAAVEVLVSRGC